MDANHVTAVTAVPTAGIPGPGADSVVPPAAEPHPEGRPGPRSRWSGGVPWSSTTRRVRSRRDRVDRGYRCQEIRTVWRQVAQETGLAHRIFSPSGVTWAPPDLSDIDTGADEGFTVHLRTGQTWDQLGRAGRRIATAFGVPALRLTELAAGWIRIELLHDYERQELPELPEPTATAPVLVEPSVPGWAVAVHTLVDVRITPNAS
ncbi:MAG: hypothetical protein K0S40_169 [Actinomycetospora sp.]|jgi:hypothetical protein|nr:hypothetical protein [Actinomycetospora sp.]